MASLGHYSASGLRSPLLLSGILHKRGAYLWHERSVCLHAHGTLTVSHREGETPAKYILQVQHGLCVSELHNHKKAGFYGWRLIQCEWNGQLEPDLGIEFATETFEVARQWLFALLEVGMTCTENIRRRYELSLPPPPPPAQAPLLHRMATFITPPRTLTRSATRALRAAIPAPRYAAARAPEADALADDVLRLALDDGGRCCILITRDSQHCCAHPRSFLATAAGRRSAVRLVDTAALVCVVVNILSLHNFADVLLVLAVVLLTGGAVLAQCTQCAQPPRSSAPASTACGGVSRCASGNAIAGIVAEGSAALSALSALLMHRAADAHDDWVLVVMVANMLGLLLQLCLVVSLATAMALEATSRQEQHDESVAGLRQHVALV